MKVLRLFFLLGIAFIIAVLIFLGVVFRDRRPSIYFAAEQGDTNLLAKYFASGNKVNTPIVCYRYGHWNAPLLAIAISGGKSDAIEFLLASGANPNQADGRGDTPLMWAIGKRGMMFRRK